MNNEVRKGLFFSLYERQFPWRNKWSELLHPGFWVTPRDIDRLKTTASLPYWQEIVDGWISQLKDKTCLTLKPGRKENFQFSYEWGGFDEAIPASICYLITGDEHYRKLMAGFLTEFAELYSQARPEFWNQFHSINASGFLDLKAPKGFAGCIRDAGLCFGLTHLYDLVYGSELMSKEHSQLLETYIYEYHLLLSRNQNRLKYNNVAAMMNSACYVSSLFDPDPNRSELLREQTKRKMEGMVQVILPDGCPWEMYDGYSLMLLSGLNHYAHILKNIEGENYYRKAFRGTGMKNCIDWFKKVVLPGNPLHLARGTHTGMPSYWAAILALYREFPDPELGWMISRTPAKTLFNPRSHDCGLSFFLYREPEKTGCPEWLSSNLPDVGVAVFRSSWDSGDATGLYFRYGFHGTGHGGLADRLTLDLIANNEKIFADPRKSDPFQHKGTDPSGGELFLGRANFHSVVMVDRTDPAITNGCLISSSLGGEIEHVSAFADGGKTPDRPFLSDPRCMYNMWLKRSDKAYPDTRIRRTVIFVDHRYFVVRDTVFSDKQHDYDWLWQLFGELKLPDAPCKSIEKTFISRSVDPSDQGGTIVRDMLEYSLGEQPLIIESNVNGTKFRLLSIDHDKFLQIGRGPDTPYAKKNGQFLKQPFNTVAIPRKGKTLSTVTVFAAGKQADNIYQLRRCKPATPDEDEIIVSTDHGEEHLRITENASEKPFKTVCRNHI